MQGLSELEHDVVGHIDHRINGTQTGAPQTFLHVQRRCSGEVNTRYNATDVARAFRGRADLHGQLRCGLYRRDSLFGLTQGQTIDSRNVPGNPRDAQAIGTIGRQANLQGVVIEVEVLAQVRPDRGVTGQFHQPIVIFRDGQFSASTQHALALNPPELGFFDFEITGEASAHFCQWRFQSGSCVGRAANDLYRLATRIHLANP